MKSEKEKRLERERPAEQRQGISPERRGAPAEESDRPLPEIPHPLDVNEIDYGERDRGSEPGEDDAPKASSSGMPPASRPSGRSHPKA